MQDGKFHPHTDHKKGVRKSRDQSKKSEGVRMKRLTQLEVDEIKRNVLPLNKHAIMMMKFHQGLAKRDRFASPRWNSMTQAERLNALNRAGVHESAMGQKLSSREELSKLSYVELPHYAKTDLGFQIFNLNREGKVRKARDEPLQPFVKKNVAENLAELNLFLKDLREEKSMRMREGKSIGIINTDLRLIGGARNSILTLLQQVPEPLHREIVEDSVRIEKEMIT